MHTKAEREKKSQKQKQQYREKGKRKRKMDTGPCLSNHWGMPEENRGMLTRGEYMAKHCLLKVDLGKYHLIIPQMSITLYINPRNLRLKSPAINNSRNKYYKKTGCVGHDEKPDCIFLYQLSSISSFDLGNC